MTKYNLMLLELLGIEKVVAPMAENMIGMKNLKTRKLYLQVYDEIKAYIIHNHLRAGDKLPTEMEMCRILGVSRNVLREAIKSLEITGVVSSKPGVGIVIQEFSTDFLFSSLVYGLGDAEDMLRQTKEVRRVLEIGFAQEAFSTITQRDIRHLGDQVVKMQAILEIRPEEASSAFGQKFAEADAAFHKSLYANVDNNLLSSIIDAFWACDKYYMVQTPRQYLEQTVEKHRRIYDAVQAGDYRQFYDAMLFHFNVDYKPQEQYQ